MMPIVGLLTGFGLAALFGRRSRQPPPSRPVTPRQATLAPPLMLVLGLAGLTAWKASNGTLRGPR